MERVFAEVDISDPTVFSPAGTFKNFGDIVNIIVRNAFMLAGVIAFILLIFGGIGIIVGAGSGDTKKLEQGKKTLTGALAGLLIVVTSVWIIQIIERVTGVPILKP